MRGKDIYSSQEETTSSPSSRGSEDKERGEESSEKVYSHVKGDLLMVRRLFGGQSCDLSQSQRENIFHTRCKILDKTCSLIIDCGSCCYCCNTRSVKALLDQGFFCKSLTLCALLVPKIGIMRHQIPMIGGMVNTLSGATLFCKITHASSIFMIHIHRDSLDRFFLIFSFNTNLGTHMGHLRFVVLF